MAQGNSRQTEGFIQEVRKVVAPGKCFRFGCLVQSQFMIVLMDGDSYLMGICFTPVELHSS